MRRLPTWLMLAAAASYAFLYLPLIIVVVYSFNDSKLNAEWVGFTLDWYRVLLQDEEMLVAARNSLLIALVSSSAATVLGTLAGLGMHRWRPGWLPLLVITPVAMPEILLGVSLLVFFIQALHLTLGFISVVLAHITFSIGFVAIVVRARLAGMDESIFEAARDLGASPWQTFRLVTFPLILPAVVAGFLMAFTLSLDDFVITFFTAGVGVSTLPLQIYSMIKIAVTPEVNAVSTLLMLLTLLLVIAASRMDKGFMRGAGVRGPGAFLPSPYGRGLVVLMLTILLAPLAHALDTLYLYNWNNYISDATIARFETQCACKVVQDYYSDNEEMLAKIAAGASGYDLIVPTGNAVESLIRSQQLRPIDQARLPHLRNIKPEFLDTPFDPGNRYSVPYAYTLTLIGYNTAKVKELNLPTDTWALIFEPRYLKKIKGRVTVLDSQRELMAAAMRYLGHSINDTDEAKWKQARDLILRAKPYWAAFNASSYIKELTVGNIWVAHGYSNDMFQANQDALRAGRPFSIGYSIPKEGAVLALDSMVLHKTGRHPELAHRFMDFMLAGENSAELTNLIGSGNPNRAAMAHIRPEIADNRAVFPDAATHKRLEMMRDLDRKSRRVLNRIWTEIKLR